MVALLKLKVWPAFLILGASAYISVLLAIFKVLHLPIPFEEYTSAGLDIWSGLGSIVGLVWIYTIVTQLNKRRNDDDKVSLTAFNISFVGIVVVMILVVWESMDTELQPAAAVFLYSFAFIFHVYTNYLAAKLMVQAENRDDVGMTLLTFIFLPIGIWFLQPRINRIFEDQFESIDPNTPLDHQLDQQRPG
ncbi:MAG: hypothetical protein WDO14_01045 [Bacteroidota bacterium]